MTGCNRPIAAIQHEPGRPETAPQPASPAASAPNNIHPGTIEFSWTAPWGQHQSLDAQHRVGRLQVRIGKEGLAFSGCRIMMAHLLNG